MFECFDRALNQEWCSHTCKSQFGEATSLRSSVACARRRDHASRMRLALQQGVSAEEWTERNQQLLHEVLVAPALHTFKNGASSPCLDFVVHRTVACMSLSRECSPRRERSHRPTLAARGNRSVGNSEMPRVVGRRRVRRTCPRQIIPSWMTWGPSWRHRRVSQGARRLFSSRLVRYVQTLRDGASGLERKRRAMEARGANLGSPAQADALWEPLTRVESMRATTQSWAWSIQRWYWRLNRGLSVTFLVVSCGAARERGVGAKFVKKPGDLCVRRPRSQGYARSARLTSVWLSK